jgi:hypothetical protein
MEWATRLVRVSPNVGQKNGLNKVMVGTFEMGTDSIRFRSELKNTLICLSRVHALTWTKGRKSFTGQIRELNFRRSLAIISFSIRNGF